MRKWYEIQFVVVTTINILTFIFTILGETLSNKYYKYSIETYTITISLLCLSGLLTVLCELYSTDNKNK